MKSIATAISLALATSTLVVVSETLHLVRLNPSFVADLGASALHVVGQYTVAALVVGIVVGVLVRDVLRQAFAISGVWYVLVSLKLLWLGSRILSNPKLAVAFVILSGGLFAAAWWLAKRFALTFSFPIALTISYTNVCIAASTGWAAHGGSLTSFLFAPRTLVILVVGGSSVGVVVAAERLARRWLVRAAPAMVLALVGVALAVAIGAANRTASEFEPTRSVAGGAAGHDIYVLSFDALRADALADYVDSHPGSRLARLYATSVSLENVATRGPTTLATLADNTLGTQPSGTCAGSLPSMLHQRGYVTTMMLGLAGATFRGADCYDQYFSGEGRALVTHYALIALVNRLTLGANVNRDKYIPANVLTQLLRDRARGGQPLFAYLHFLELHAPYVPSARQADIPFKLAVRKFMKRCVLAGCDQSVPENARLIETARTGYRELLDDADRTVGAVLEIAEARGRPFRIVVTSDHGELFGEYGGFAHKFGFVPELRHVPFLVHDSAAAAAERRCELLTSEEAMWAAVLGTDYPDHDQLKLDVSAVGVATIDRAAATIAFQLSADVGAGGVSRNIHRRARATLSYPIVRCP